MKSDGITVLKFVHIYGNLLQFGQTVGKGSLKRNELISHFIRGFNSCSGTMDFVDLGGLIPWKIMGFSSVIVI
jgi:hypothetical protein